MLQLLEAGTNGNELLDILQYIVDESTIATGDEWTLIKIV